MKEVTSAVWMDGLDLSYLREQVRAACLTSASEA